jgi:hypothetical protein
MFFCDCLWSALRDKVRPSAMKSTPAYILLVAATCCALLISSANAGGRRQGFGTSSSTTSSLLPNGRSPLGEPVFLIPSKSGESVPSGGPIGGYVPPRTPLPPLIAPNTKSAALIGPVSDGVPGTQVIKASTSTISAAPSTGDGGHLQLSSISKTPGLSDMPSVSGQSTRVIFTPPPTIVGVPPSVTGTGNIAGANLADHTFGGSMLDTGLGAKSAKLAGSSAQDPSNPTPWIRITPLQYNGPTVEVPTTSSVAKTSSSTNP